MTTIDGNGIIRYEDTDGAPTPPVLNLGLQSVSDAISNIGQFRVVADIVDRNAKAAAFGPTVDKPFVVYRKDGPYSARFEWTINGTAWHNIVELPDLLTGGTITANTFTGSALIYHQNVPPVNYARRLVIDASILAFNVVGSWDGALSVGIGNVVDAQRFSSFPTGQSRVTTNLSLIYTLPANEASNIRLWFRRNSTTGSITSNASARHTYVDVQSYPLPANT